MQRKKLLQWYQNRMSTVLLEEAQSCCYMSQTFSLLQKQKRMELSLASNEQETERCSDWIEKYGEILPNTEILQ